MLRSLYSDIIGIRKRECFNSSIKIVAAIFFTITFLLRFPCVVSEYELVFAVEAFSGVDALDYFRTGAMVNPDSRGSTNASRLYRHADIRNKIESAKFIKLGVFNFEKSQIVSEVVFRGTAHYETWFARNTVVASVPWDFSSYSPLNDGSNFALTNQWVPLRQFYINNNFGGCHNDAGRGVTSVPKLKNTIHCKKNG